MSSVHAHKNFIQEKNYFSELQYIWPPHRYKSRRLAEFSFTYSAVALISNECRYFAMASRNAVDTLFLACCVVSVTAAMPQARMDKAILLLGSEQETF